MVIRFNDTMYRAAELRDAVYACYVAATGPDGFVEDGVQYTPFTLKEHVHLLDNYDLYIDDDYHSDLTGMFMMALRGYGFLEEKAEVIVPRVDREPRKTVILDTEPIPEDDNIERFEDHLPDNAWDDGKFEEEMEEILNNPDLYKD